MKVIGHATAALLIEVETGQLYARRTLLGDVVAPSGDLYELIEIANLFRRTAQHDRQLRLSFR